ncbi:RNase H family protein [Rothia sp. CCM 9418]|uniref:RNase H family protein n=1 Tax=unclassified Rothia (in: high G+C Gram-positive bacteria) TaxID=2689056 RepID=UPI003ABFFBC0
MKISPAHIKKTTLTWEAPDYTSSYPEGFIDLGVAVIALLMESIQEKGRCYTGLSCLIFISRENGDREILEIEPVTDSCSHSLLEPCDEAHVRMIGRAILKCWEYIPALYKNNLVTVTAHVRYLKLLFQQFPTLRTIMQYRPIDKLLNPQDSYSLGELHIRLTSDCDRKILDEHIQRAAEIARQEKEEDQRERPVEELPVYEVFTDCSFRASKNKQYSRGGRMGIGGVSEEGFYFHLHYDATNIMTGELSAMLAAFNIFYHPGRQLVIHTDSLGALTFVLRLAHNRCSFEKWVNEGVQDHLVVAEMMKLTEAIRDYRVIVKHIPGHSGHGLQESSDSVSKMHRHFPGQVVAKGYVHAFNQRCESIIVALTDCERAVRLQCPSWVQIRPSAIHARNRFWR